MMDKKLNDEEIIQSLRQCASDEGGCVGCVLKDMHCANCIRRLQAESLNLINRQKAEIERLGKVAGKDFNQWNMLAEKTKQHYADLYEDAKDSIKAEAYKEFVNKLKNSNEFYGSIRAIGNVDKMDCIVNCIDNLLKEMVGEEE